MSKNYVGIVERAHPGIPLLLIDFDDCSINDVIDSSKAYDICRTIGNRFTYCTYDRAYNKFYHLEKMSLKLLPYWNTDKDEFIEEIKKIPGDVIQLCGIYKELCVLKVASIITECTNKQVIIVNELCINSSEEITDTAIEFNVEVQWLGEIYMSPDSRKGQPMIAINQNGKIDLSSIPLKILAEEINRRKKDRVPELIEIINNAILELKDLNCDIINASDERFTVAEIYMENDKVYLSEVTED